METEKQRTIWLEEAMFFLFFSESAHFMFPLPASEGLSASQDSKEMTSMADRAPHLEKSLFKCSHLSTEEHCHPGGNSTESLSLQVDPSFRELALRNGVKSLVSVCKESMPN